MPLKGGNLLPGTYVPQSDVRRLIYPPTPGGQGGSIRRNRHRKDPVIGFPHLQNGDLLSARHVPQPGRLVVGTGGEGSPIWRERQGMDEPCLKSPYLFSPPNVPQGDPPTSPPQRSTGCEQRSIGRKRYRRDGIIRERAFEGGDLFPGRHVPQQDLPAHPGSEG